MRINACDNYSHCYLTPTAFFNFEVKEKGSVQEKVKKPVSENMLRRLNRRYIKKEPQMKRQRNGGRPIVRTTDSYTIRQSYQIRHRMTNKE